MSRSGLAPPTAVEIAIIELLLKFQGQNIPQIFHFVDNSGSRNRFRGRISQY